MRHSFVGVFPSTVFVHGHGVGLVADHVGGDNGVVGCPPEPRQSGPEGVNRPANVARLDEGLALLGRLAFFPQVADDAGQQSQYPTGTLKVSVRPPPQVQGVDQRRVEWIRGQEAVTIRSLCGLLWHLVLVGLVELHEGVGDLGVDRVVAEPLEQPSPNDLVDLLIGYGLQVGRHPPETLLQAAEDLLPPVAAGDLQMAGRQRGDDDGPRHLGGRLRQLLYEAHRLVGQCPLADRNRHRPDTVVGQLVQQDQTGDGFP